MELQTFAVQTRTTNGKGPAGRDRQSGNVPGVLYGAGKDNISIMVGSKELELLLHHGQGEHAMVELTFADSPELNGPAILKEVQHHRVRGQALHFDLMRIDLDKKIITLVPVRMDGRSIGVIEGGVLDYHMREIEVECLPMDVPEVIVGDITELNIGMSIHVRELVAIDNVQILTDPDRTVAAVQQPRVVEEEVAVVEEGEEGEVAEGEEGEGGEETSDADES
jgi:large subunit ribosomal protein L25